MRDWSGDDTVAVSSARGAGNVNIHLPLFRTYLTPTRAQDLSLDLRYQIQAIPSHTYVCLPTHPPVPSILRAHNTHSRRCQQRQPSHNPPTMAQPDEHCSASRCLEPERPSGQGIRPSQYTFFVALKTHPFGISSKHCQSHRTRRHTLSISGAKHDIGKERFSKESGGIPLYT